MKRAKIYHSESFSVDVQILNYSKIPMDVRNFLPKIDVGSSFLYQRGAVPIFDDWMKSQKMEFQDDEKVFVINVIKI